MTPNVLVTQRHARAAVAPARRILLVDDHVLTRAGLRFILERELEAAELEEVATYAEATQRLAAGAFDLVLVDCGLPDLRGLDALAELIARANAAPVVAISRAWDRELVNAAMLLGLRAFIPKTSTPQIMVAALGIVFSGGFYVPPDALSSLAPPPSAPSLSTRQREVLSFIVQGHTNKEIAAELGMSVSTVRVHLQAVFRALGVCNRTQACQIALRRQLVRG